MREGPSSTPDLRQNLGEGLLELDEGRLQEEGAGRAGVPLGVSGTLAMAEAPASCSTAPSPLPLSNSPEKMDESGDDFVTVQDVNWNDQVLDSVLKTPAKSLTSLKRKQKSPATTPSSSTPSDSSSAKIPRLLLPSPGKRWLQAKEASLVEEPEQETVEELAERIVFGEISPEVCKSNILFKIRTNSFYL